MIEKLLISEKNLFVLYYTHDKVEKYHVLHNKVALLMSRRSKYGTGHGQ